MYTGLIYMTEKSTQQKQSSKLCELISSVFPDVPQLRRLFRNRMVWLDDENNWICYALILFLPSLPPSLPPFLPSFLPSFLPFLPPSLLYFLCRDSVIIFSLFKEWNQEPVFTHINKLCQENSLRWKKEEKTVGKYEETKLRMGNTGTLGSGGASTANKRSVPPWTPFFLN